MMSVVADTINNKGHASQSSTNWSEASANPTVTEAKDLLGGEKSLPASAATSTITATATAAGTATTSSSTERSGMNQSPHTHAFPFPEDLMQILKEVAVQGSSSVLPWKQDDVVWKRPESRTSTSKETAVTTQNNGTHNSSTSHHIHHHPSDSTRRHHDYYAQARQSRGSHKRTRVSTISTSRHLHAHSGSHRSHYANSSSSSSSSRANHTYSSSNRIMTNATSSSSASASTSATMTTTMVLESKPMLRTLPNGTVQQVQQQQHQQQQQQQQSTTSTPGNLFVLRPQTSSSTSQHASLYQNTGSLFLPNSSTGRSTASINSYTAASGSEYEDTSQYECDSEGTSATSNSEMSFSSSISRRRGMSSIGNIGSRANISLTMTKRNDPMPRPQYWSVRDALASALTSVLDHYYHNRGGYKLSPFEKRIYNAATVDNPASQNVQQVNGATIGTLAPTENVINSEEVFQKRKKRLIEMLGKFCNVTALSDQTYSETDKRPTIALYGINNAVQGSPPFTIQRLAEVLLEPERYYSQTHKLCNCLEKLLLVTSSASAFGGVAGGDTTHSRQEETEIAALSEERKRLRREFRQRHKKSRRSSNVTAVVASKEEGAKMGTDIDDGNRDGSGIPDADADDDDDELLPAAPKAKVSDPLDAAARATLRSKFDHVGIDPHSQAAMANSRDVIALMESRRLTNNGSPPPPPPLSQNLLQQQQQLHQRQSSPLRSSPSPSSSPESSKAMLSPRIPSPLLFHTVHNHGLDVSPPTLSPIMNSSFAQSMNVPLPLHTTHNHHPPLSLPISSSLLSAQSHATMYHHGDSSGSIETQKSSPASSDLDSESDIDDSASDDRSDGSDNEKTSYEPLTAAQAMALNRRHQQARIQSRLLTAAATQQQQQQQQQQEQHQHPQHKEQGNMTSNKSAQSSGIMDGYHHRSSYINSNTTNEISATTTTTTATRWEHQGSRNSDGDNLDSTRAADDSGGSDSSSTDQVD